MNLELTEEQLALRDTVRRFLTEKAPVASYVRPLLQPNPPPNDGTPNPPPKSDAGGASRGQVDGGTRNLTGRPSSVWNGLAELGTTGVLVPDEHAGAGMTMVEAGIVAEELGRALHPGPWLSTAVAVPRALARFGTEDEPEVAKLLAGIADGSTIATVALVEPGTTPNRPPLSATGDASRGQVGAVTERAGEIRLTGEKMEVADAASATVLLVVAADSDGPALFAVDTSSPRVEVTPQPGVDLTRPLFRVRLDGVPARRLGAAAPEAVQAVVDDMLVAWAADALGAAQAVFELAVDYAKVRTQFGKPIGAFQAVQHLCVDMYETIELARGGVMHALWAADAASVSAEERHLAAVRAKAFSGRLATVGDIAVQVFGGIGFTWEHDAHLYLRRLLGWSAFLGGPAPYLQELGAQLTRSHSTDSTMTPPLRSTG
jgi:alkylation response protein AidB-like acyl-CoA dehydrogenase